MLLMNVAEKSLEKKTPKVDFAFQCSWKPRLSRWMCVVRRKEERERRGERQSPDWEEIATREKEV